MLSAKSVSDVDLYKIAQYKGQVHTFDLLLDLDTFMSDEIERREDGTPI